MLQNLVGDKRGEMACQRQKTPELLTSEGQLFCLKRPNGGKKAPAQLRSTTIKVKLK